MSIRDMTYRYSIVEASYIYCNGNDAACTVTSPLLLG